MSERGAVFLLLLVCEGVDHSVSEGDGLNSTIGNNDVLDDVLDESARYLGIYLADVLLVIDVAIFDELGDHDEVSCFFEELIIRHDRVVTLRLDFGKPFVGFFERIKELLAFDKVVLFGHLRVSEEVEGFQSVDSGFVFALPFFEDPSFIGNCAASVIDGCGFVLKPRRTIQEQCAELLQPVSGDGFDIAEHRASKQLALQSICGSGFAVRLLSLDDICDVVEDKRAESDIGDVLVFA